MWSTFKGLLWVDDLFLVFFDAEGFPGESKFSLVKLFVRGFSAAFAFRKLFRVKYAGVMDYFFALK